MKKLFALVALLAISAGVTFAADTFTGSMVEKYTSGIVQKEQQMRDDAAARQAEREAQKAEFQKKMEAQQAEREAKRAEIQKKIDADRAAREARQAETERKIQEKKDAWNTLIGK